MTQNNSDEIVRPFVVTPSKLLADASGCQGRASKIMLNGVSVARLTVANPPAVITSRSFEKSSDAAPCA
jgi:hypothetical protein